MASSEPLAGSGRQPLRDVTAESVEAGGVEEVEQDIEQDSELISHDEAAAVWRKNELLTYAANFMHMAMYTMCLGAVFDIFVYNLSQSQHVLLPATDAVRLGQTSTPMPPIDMETFNDFELTFLIRPSSDPVVFPQGDDCKRTFTCASSVLHVTDGQGNGDCCRTGNRVPFLFLPNASTRLFVDMDIVGQNESMNRSENFRAQVCGMTDELPINVWSRVKVIKVHSKLSKGKFDHDADQSDVQLMMFVNGTKACSVPGTKGKELPAFKHTQAFLGALQHPFDDLHPAANVDLKDIRYGKPASNLIVGAVNSIQGLLSLVIAYPIGYLGDRTSRYSVMRWSFVAAIIAAALLSIGVIKRRLDWLVAGVVVFTVYQQSVSAALTAILADNVTRVRRTTASVNWKTCSALAMSFAPGLQFLVEVARPAADSWSQSTFVWLLCPGWLLLPFVMVAALSIKTVGKKHSAIPNSDEFLAIQEMRLPSVPKLSRSWLSEVVCCGSKRWLVVALSANIFFIATLLANGMTSRYFSLYYTEVMRFSPAQLCALNAVCRLFIAIVAQGGKPLSRSAGRSNTAVALHVGAALFTLGIYGAGVASPNVWLSCSCYLMRFACLHTRDPILSAITMDVVPLDQRSRWAALNSIRTLSFAASAALGGYLADLYGYQTSFTVTVITLLGSTVLAFPALVWLPRHEGEGQSVSGTGSPCQVEG